MTQTLPAAKATEFDVRVLADDEIRAANAVFREALHQKPFDDEKWPTAARFYEPGRTYGTFAGDTMVGTTTSLTSSLTLPGGSSASTAAVTAVGVRTDHRRRGVLTGLMRRQLTDFAAAGEVFATLHASEPGIYGRFGYGLGTLSRIMRIRPGRTRLRPEVPTSGTVRLLSLEESLRLLPEAYARILPTRAGLMGRSTAWWSLGYERHDYLRVAAHYDRDGTIDGFLAYEPGSGADPLGGSVLVVLDFQATDQLVTNDLWRFLLGVDLVEEITLYVRPLDDPIEAMLDNYFYAARTEPDEELWVRVIDVPAALAARTYGLAESVVIEIVDPLLPDNSGRYLVGQHGAERTDAPAALTLGIEALGMIYLGTWRPSALAAIGRIEGSDPMALAAADRLFATDRPSWCGTLF